PGNELRISDEKLESARKFENKIWNAARFVVANLAGEQGTRNEEQGGRELSLEDRWILSRLDSVAAETNKLLSEFQINEAARLLYEFFWNEYCDWYVEMAKVRLKAGNRSAMPVLVRVLESSMRLMHPFMPFVTEAVWQELRRAVDGLEPDAVIVAAYPEGGAGADREAERRLHTV